MGREDIPIFRLSLSSDLLSPLSDSSLHYLSHIFVSLHISQQYSVAPIWKVPANGPYLQKPRRHLASIIFGSTSVNPQRETY